MVGVKPVLGDCECAVAEIDFEAVPVRIVTDFKDISHLQGVLAKGRAAQLARPSHAMTDETSTIW
jgi:hypothetical protein